jgi:hypothetical protein
MMSSKKLMPILIIKSALSPIKNPSNGSEDGRLSRAIHARQDVWPQMGISFAVRQVDIQRRERPDAFRYQSHQRHKRYRNAKPARVRHERQKRGTAGVVQRGATCDPGVPAAWLARPLDAVRGRLPRSVSRPIPSLPGAITDAQNEAAREVAPRIAHLGRHEGGVVLSQVLSGDCLLLYA